MPMVKYIISTESENYFHAGILAPAVTERLKSFEFVVCLRLAIFAQESFSIYLNQWEKTSYLIGHCSLS